MPKVPMICSLAESNPIFSFLKVMLPGHNPQALLDPAGMEPSGQPAARTS